MDSTNNSIIAIDDIEGDSVSIVGDSYRIIIDGEQTNGAYSLVDMLIPPNCGPPPHSHAKFQKAFHILDGEIEVITKEQKYTASKGSHVNIPFRGPVHKFVNRTDKITHRLCLITPAGIEKMFKEIGEPVATNSFLPRSNPTPEEQNRVIGIAEKYGQKLYPPDY